MRSHLDRISSGDVTFMFRPTHSWYLQVAVLFDHGAELVNGIDDQPSAQWGQDFMCSCAYRPLATNPISRMSNGLILYIPVRYRMICHRRLMILVEDLSDCDRISRIFEVW